MAVFTCPKCSIVIVENAEAERAPTCPACDRKMLPKRGPGAIDMDFPQKPTKETVLDLEVPEAVRQLDAKRRREREKRK